MNTFDHVTFISAGAGSGKTYRLTEELEAALLSGIDPASVIATTFTVKAAAELGDRVRARLINGGHVPLAEEMQFALVGTVHSVCERLLKRFAFELGTSTELNVLSLEDGARLFRQALDDTLTSAQVNKLDVLAARFRQDSWHDIIRSAADKVRENDIAATSLARMGGDSATDLLAFFGTAMDNTLSRELEQRLTRTIAQLRVEVDTTIDTTAGTARALKRLVETDQLLAKDPHDWQAWMTLCTLTATKKSEPSFATLRAVAALHAQHAQFHKDIRAIITDSLEVAAAALDRFQELKRERGLIDFLDMEHHLLGALDNPAIQNRIRDDLELLLVDEFQDTNPMQLALFVKLARLADKVIFVGDVKQAIYRFRGSDPDLVFATLSGMSRQSADTDVLPFSWRSRPALVGYTNALFSRTFAGTIPPEQVTLQAKRSEPNDAPAVAHWQLSGKARGERLQSLVSGIVELAKTQFPITDPQSDESRPIRWEDIAILARTNVHVEETAVALKDAGIPVKMSVMGLLNVPEVCLARSCLRRLNDITDTLATAEILTLADSEEPESWLAHRLDHLSRGLDSARWREDDHAIISRLAELRIDSALRSPVEIVARVLNDVGIRQVVTAWGPDAIKVAQRQRNLDAFLQLAVLYEDHCSAQGLAASLTGFLFWLEAPSSPELDLQPMVTGGDAVHVLTYHRAKGLEWPVVITLDFDSKTRDEVWGIRVELTGAFDIDAPLANRRLRYWPDIFGGRTNNLPVRDHILASSEALTATAYGASESQRLAYVGITRARDLLVIALGEKLKDNTWWHTFADASFLPDSSGAWEPGTTDPVSDPPVHLREAQAHLRLAQAPIPTAHRLLSAFDHQLDNVNYTPRWFPPMQRATATVRALVSPSSLPPVEGYTCGEIIDFGPRLALRGDDMNPIGNAIHAVIAAELVNPDISTDRAEALLAAWGVDAFVDAAEVVAAARRFRNTLHNKFTVKQIVAEAPVCHPLADGRVVKGWIDVLVQTNNGWLIIDHKSSPRPRKDLPTDVLVYSGQLQAYRQALEAAGQRVAGLWVHFPVLGALAEVCNTVVPRGDAKPAAGEQLSLL